MNCASVCTTAIVHVVGAGLRPIPGRGLWRPLLHHQSAHLLTCTMLQPFPKVSQVVDLLECVSRGSKRSRLWLVKVLGQITADKAVADAVADRQGVRRSSWKDFVPTWGLTRQATCCGCSYRRLRLYVFRARAIFRSPHRNPWG